MPFNRLPSEILTTIAIHLVLQQHPSLPPYDLLALTSSCRLLHRSLSSHHSPSLWSTAFRYRFDSSSVIRRNFSPNGRDYYDQLKQYTGVIAAIRTLNIYRDDIDDTLRTIYVMLLDNNGKNRSQLEMAGVDRFLDIYVRTRMWAEAPTNQGWPLDTNANAYALWAMWQLTTPEKLVQEVHLHREQIVTLLLPFVLNPYRYHQAEAPFSHFTLPLTSSPGTTTTTTATTTTTTDSAHPLSSAHGPYPIYVDPTRAEHIPYFGAYPSLAPPPITTPAKLLYFARREIYPFRIPDGLPQTRADVPAGVIGPTPTIEDFVELNSFKGAEPPLRVTWDWERGGRVVDGVLCVEGVGEGDDDDDDSVRWDSDYWRRMLCRDAWQRLPKWRPGKVYVPGSMDGLWQGRLVVRSFSFSLSLFSFDIPATA